MLQNVQIFLNDMALTQPQVDFVERAGRWWEQVGTRSAGRILGWLMICDPPHRSAAQLQEELHLSAGSISTQTSSLERVGFVERITFPGDRASYYQLRPHIWLELMRAEQDWIRRTRALADSAHAVVPETRPDRVTELAEVSDFFLAEWPGLMARLEAHVKEEKAS